MIKFVEITVNYENILNSRLIHFRLIFRYGNVEQVQTVYLVRVNFLLTYYTNEIAYKFVLR